MASGYGFSWIEALVKGGLLVGLIAFGVHAQQSCTQATTAEEQAGAKPTVIPDTERSIAPGTYLGAVVTGRERSMRSLDRTDNIRKQQNKEADDFEKRGP